MNKWIKVQYFQAPTITDLANVIDGWMMEHGEPLEILQMSHAFSEKQGLTALVLWRLKAPKAKPRKRNRRS